MDLQKIATSVLIKLIIDTVFGKNNIVTFIPALILEEVIEKFIENIDLSDIDINEVVNGVEKILKELNII